MHTGKKLGQVYDLLFDDEGVLRGVQLDAKGIWRKGPFIPVEQIKSIGEDALTVETDDASNTHPSNQFHSVIDGDEKLKGKPVITTNGVELGIVEDVYFHEDMGTIVGYELTDGFLSDVTRGRKVLPKREPYTVGSDAIVVPQEMESQLQDTMDE